MDRAPDLGQGCQELPPEQAVMRWDLAAEEAAARPRGRKRTFQMQRWPAGPGRAVAAPVRCGTLQYREGGEGSSTVLVEVTRLNVGKDENSR